MFEDVPSVARLIEYFSRLPGIGPRTAQRLAYHLLLQDNEEAFNLAAALVDIKQKTTRCNICFTISEGETCAICLDEARDPELICVVEEPRDLYSFEKTGEFVGYYHVLGGAIAPLRGKGPETLTIDALVARVKAKMVGEVILATSTNISGETTALYLAKVLHRHFPELKVTRLACGLPMGGELEYLDGMTLTRALSGRLLV